MNAFKELWFWMMLIGVIIFIIAVYVYSTYPSDETPTWVYIWMALGSFIFFISVIILGTTLTHANISINVFDSLNSLDLTKNRIITMPVIVPEAPIVIIPSPLSLQSLRP